MKFYIDGELVVTESYLAAVPPRHEGEPGMIGAYMPEDNDPEPVTDPSHFKGNIKEVAIFSEALDQAGVTALYNNFTT